jgi:hypothetical protein
MPDLRPTLLLLALAALPGPLAAQTFRDTHFANPDLPGGPCYQRTYTTAHLADHPQQQVTQITLRPSLLSPEVATGDYLLDLFVMRRGDPEELMATAYCTPRSTRMDCLLEGDAGGFRLEAAGPARLRLTVGPQGVLFEGRADVLELSATTGDDRVFLIPNAAPEACH